MKSFEKAAFVVRLVLIATIECLLLWKVAPLAQTLEERCWVYGIALVTLVAALGVDVSDAFRRRIEHHERRKGEMAGEYEHEQRDAHRQDARRFKFLWAAAATAVVLSIIALQVLMDHAP